MPGKLKIRSTNSKVGYVVYHGIKIAPAEQPRSEAAKIIGKELRKRSESRGERKSA